MRTRRRPGMTLTELLVIMAIIALLMAAVLPALGRARNAARRTRLAADLNTISIGLEAYRTDFGDYPRPDRTDFDTYRGAATLCRALLAPGDKNGPLADGADGPGFRVTRIESEAVGRVYGPYLKPEQFKTRKSIEDSVYPATSRVLLDIDSNPIMYYVARAAMPNIHVGESFVALVDPNMNPATSPSPLYNYYDNSGPYPYGQMRMRVLLGDLNINGAIDGTEKAATTAPYLLWCAGPDGQFGLLKDPRLLSIQQRIDARNDVDDVTNFAFR